MSLIPRCDRCGVFWNEKARSMGENTPYEIDCYWPSIELKSPTVSIVYHFCEECFVYVQAALDLKVPRRRQTSSEEAATKFHDGETNHEGGSDAGT